MEFNAVFDAIKIGHRLPGSDPRVVLRRGQEAGDHQLPHPQAGAGRSVLRARSLAPPRTGSATAASTKRSATRARSATAAAWRSPGPRCAASAWATSSWPPRCATSGISRASPPAWACCWTSAPVFWRRCSTSPAILSLTPASPLWPRTRSLSEKEYRDMREKYEDDFEAGMGAEAVKKLLPGHRSGGAVQRAPRRAEGRLRPEEGPHCQAPGGGGRLPYLRQQARSG